MDGRFPPPLLNGSRTLNARTSIFFHRAQMPWRPIPYDTRPTFIFTKSSTRMLTNFFCVQNSDDKQFCNVNMLSLCAARKIMSKPSRESVHPTSRFHTFVLSTHIWQTPCPRQFTLYSATTTL